MIHLFSYRTHPLRLRTTRTHLMLRPSVAFPRNLSLHAASISNPTPTPQSYIHFPSTMTVTHTMPPKRRVRKSLPAVLMRAGTSKGLFIHRKDLPLREKDWKEPLLAVMGSRYKDARQLDGVGGATSVTSKVAVVGPSTRPGIDIDYTFVQVAIGAEKIDLTGNCGNICSGVGPFAVQEGFVVPKPGQETIDVRIFNTNTSRTIVETVKLDENGNVEEDGDCVIPGVKGSGSAIQMAFIEPGGSMTGTMFPSGKLSETILLEGVAHLPPFEVNVTLIDSANPFVLVDRNTLPLEAQIAEADSLLNIEIAEAIRRTGAMLMGLADNMETAALTRGTPKLALVSAAHPSESAHVKIQAYSMGKPHPSLQLTGGVCLASAVCIAGTVPQRLAQTSLDQSQGLFPKQPYTLEKFNGYPQQDAKRQFSTLQTRKQSQRQVRIQHSRGVMEVEVWTRPGHAGDEILRCVSVRTARRLFEGNVLYYI